MQYQNLDIDWKGIEYLLKTWFSDLQVLKENEAGFLNFEWSHGFLQVALHTGKEVQVAKFFAALQMYPTPMPRKSQVNIFSVFKLH